MNLSPRIDLERKYKPYVIALSIAIPLVVALLFNVSVEGVDLSFLPPIYAGINGLTALLLIVAVWAIKKGNRSLHQRLMTVAVGASVLFLVMYVAYHMTSESTAYGDVNHDGICDAAETATAGAGRSLYIAVLLSHILLSLIVLPLVMMTYLKGWTHQLQAHRKWAKVTFPIWLYVAVTGVIVYWMIRPYY